MEEGMEISAEENLCCMEITAASEHSFHELFNNSVRSLNQENQMFSLSNESSNFMMPQKQNLEYQFLQQNEDYPKQYYQEGEIFEEAQENQDKQEYLEYEDHEQNHQEIQDSNEEKQEEVEEVEHPLYKLNEVDTEACIRTEIKQLILTKVSNEIDSRILSDTACGVEEQIENLKTRTDELLHKIQELDKEIEMDENRFRQSEETLTKTKEMILLLDENVNKLSQRLKENSIEEFYNRSVDQENVLRSLKQLYSSKLKENQNLNILRTPNNDTNTNLKQELAFKKEALFKLKTKQSEMRQIVFKRNTEIEKYTEKKNFLMEKLATIKFNKEKSQNEAIEHKNIFQNICANKKKQLEKLENIDNEKIKLEKIIEESLQVLEEMKKNINFEEEQKSEKMSRLNELNDYLNTVKFSGEESAKCLQQNCDDIDVKQQHLLSLMENSTNNNEQLLNEIIALNKVFIAKNEEKIQHITQVSKRQNIIHKINVEIIKKQIENESEQKRNEVLKNQYEETSSQLNALENHVVNEKERINHELLRIKSEFQIAHENNTNTNLDIKKKREYVLANSKFLTEKSENLHKEMNEIANSVKNLQEENISLRTIIEKKTAHFNECKIKLSTLKEMNLKSNLKTFNEESTTKKVQFNDILSFKSATSSENSNQLADNKSTNHLETVSQP